MSITIGSVFHGHWVRKYITTTRVMVTGSVGRGVSNTTATDLFKRGVNRSGQAGVEIDFYNESEKAIKNVSFQVVPVNKVNDVVGEAVQLQATGPIKKHSVNKRIWDYVWTNSSIHKILITGLTIEYMDGTIDKQSSLVESGEKTIRYDSAVGRTWICPVILTAILLAGIVWGYREGSFGILPLYNNPYVLLLAIVLGLMTIVFSRNFRNRIATVLSGSAMAIVSAVACVKVRRIHLNDASGGTIGTYIETILKANDMITPMVRICTAIMCVALIVCVLGVIKKDKIKTMVIDGAFALSGIGIIIAWLLTMLSIKQGVYTSYLMNQMLEDLYVWLQVVIPMASWGLMWAVAKRCRNNYNIE